MPNAEKEDVLKIRCSDARTKKLPAIKENWVHEIRLPGGILFPNLCARSILKRGQTFETSSPINTEIKKRIDTLFDRITPETGLVMGELIILLTVDAMYELKKPKQIILPYHSFCGAANLISFGEREVHNASRRWRSIFNRCYPEIRVRHFREEHSEDGHQHHGHEELDLLEAA